jgi:hypothetical protein
MRHTNDEDAPALAEASSKKSGDDLRLRRPPSEAEQYWREFGFNHINSDQDGSAVHAIVPAGYVAFRARDAAAVEMMKQDLRTIGVPPSLWCTIAKDDQVVVYALSTKITIDALRLKIHGQVEILGQGQAIPLPVGEWLEGSAINAENLEELPEIATLDAYQESTQLVLDPLSRFSLRGRGAELEAEAKLTRYILGKVILAGQATVIYAAPNAGKTLLFLFMLVQAVLTGEIDPARVFYVNADDSSSGVAEKLLLLDDLGVHTLVPGFNGFKASDLTDSLAELIATDQCSDVIVALDTTKKFVDLMDKKNSASFGNVMRQFVMKGGTIIALAHTRKNPGSTGQAVYGGTSDIVEDFDAACLLVPISENDQSGERIVQFQYIKRRGPNVEESYAYACEPSLSYSERFASVRLVGDQEAEEVAAAGERQTDQPLIDALKACLASGIGKKMALVQAASARSGASRRTVMQVLERYTGPNPDEHLWSYSVQERGAKMFRLH